MSNVAKKKTATNGMRFRPAFERSITGSRTPTEVIREQAAWLALFAEQNEGGDEQLASDLRECAQHLLRVSFEVHELERRDLEGLREAARVSALVKVAG